MAARRVGMSRAAGSEPQCSTSDGCTVLEVEIYPSAFIGLMTRTALVPLVLSIRTMVTIQPGQGGQPGVGGVAAFATGMDRPVTSIHQLRWRLPRRKQIDFAIAGALLLSATGCAIRLFQRAVPLAVTGGLYPGI
jgi:hypothetical protein